MRYARVKLHSGSDVPPLCDGKAPRAARSPPAVTLAISTAVLFLVAGLNSVDASNEVREGKKPEFELAPWSSWPTQVRWEPGASKAKLLGCESLFYLGAQSCG